MRGRGLSRTSTGEPTKNDRNDVGFVLLVLEGRRGLKDFRKM